MSIRVHANDRPLPKDVSCLPSHCFSGANPRSLSSDGGHARSAGFSAPVTVIGFGPFRLDSDRRLLTRDGAPVPLGGRALDILVQLAARKGTIVSKQHLVDTVWQGRSVEENNLAVHVSALRRVLGMTADNRSLIQTIPRRGYMLITDTGHEAGSRQPNPDYLLGGPGTVARDVVSIRATNTFIGRIEERAALAMLLAEHALVTITAAGGMGKTRLAQQVALDAAGMFRDGVFVADLTHVEDPARAVDHVAAHFPIGGSERPIVEQLTQYLRGRRMLLMFDNCEHVLEPVAALAAAILDQCPGVSMLATSREALGVAGECLFHVAPLPAPDGTTRLSASEALHFDAVRLFVDRAVATVPGFVFDDGVTAAIVDICAQLDGIALAIEMAVPRLRVLTPAQLAVRLHENIRLLTATDRAAAPRHRSLHATMEWSHSLLSEGEQRLFRRLAIFSGPFDFAAVQAIASEPGQDTLDLLTGLVDRSLVVADTSAGIARYGFLQTIRHYAQERLAESGDQGLRRRHAEYYTVVFEAASEAWPTTPTVDWVPPVAAAAAELRSALHWCFGPEGDAALGLRLVGASMPFWWELPNLPLRESRSWFDTAVTRIEPGTPPLVAARVWLGHAWRDMRQSDRANLPAAERAVSLFRQTPDRVGLGAALWRAASAALRPDTPTPALDWLNEAEEVLRPVMPGKWLALVLIRKGDVHMRAGENGAALAAYEEALELAYRTGHWYGLTNGGANMADLLFQLGRAEEALTRLRTLRRILPLGPRTPLTCTLAAHLAMAELPEEASEAIAEVVTMAPGIGYGSALARSMETLALLHVEAGRAPVAARLAGYAWATMPPATRWGAPRAVFQRLETALAAALSPGDRERYHHQGAAWDEASAAVEAKAALDRSSTATEWMRI